MITLYRRGRNGPFYLNVSYDGKRYRESLKTRDREVAEALRRQRELQVLSGGTLGVRPWETFQKEFLSWIEPHVRPNTMKGYRFTIERFGKYLDEEKIVKLDQVTPAVISNYCRVRREDIHPSRKRKLTEGGIKFDLRILHRVFGYAIECSYILKNPVRAKNLSSSAGRTMPFTREEIEQTLSAAKDPQMRAIVSVFIHTGMRIGDVTDLRKDAVGRSDIQVTTRKRGKPVRLKLHEDTRTAIEQHLEKQNAAQKSSPLMFSTETGALFKNLDKRLKTVWKKANVASAHAHRFRDTFAVQILGQGGSLYDVAKLLGIGVGTAERHYAPYVRELRERGAKLIEGIDLAVASLPLFRRAKSA